MAAESEPLHLFHLFPPTSEHRLEVTQFTLDSGDMESHSWSVCALPQPDVTGNEHTKQTGGAMGSGCQEKGRADGKAGPAGWEHSPGPGGR